MIMGSRALLFISLPVLLLAASIPPSHIAHAQTVSTPARIFMVPAAEVLQRGQTRQFSTIVFGQNGEFISGLPVTWTSSNSSVVSIDLNGLVSALALGSATITAAVTGGGVTVTGTADASVVEPELPPASIQIIPDGSLIPIGGTSQFEAIALDINGESLRFQPMLTWISSDESVATVDESGLVTGIAVGTAIITAAGDGLSGSVSVTVEAPAAPPPPPPVTEPLPLTFGTSAILDKATYSPGEAFLITAFVNATQDVPDALIDIEIYNASGIKVLQHFAPAALLANQNFALDWNTAVPAEGPYTVKIGVFTSAWTLYIWNDSAAAFTVSQETLPPPPPPEPAPVPGIFSDFAVSDNPVYAPSAPAVITTTVLPDVTIPNAIIDVEIFDVANVKIAQQFVTANLIAGQAFTNSWNTAAPQAPGQYTIKVGVFTANWASLHNWNNAAGAFVVSAPGEPAPALAGGSPTLTLIAPTDGADVSGLTQLKAAMNALPISSYAIGWRTDATGPFIPMANDATNSYKTNFIDFTGWTWRADNLYPLEFQAADLSGTILGNLLIQVHVLH